MPVKIIIKTLKKFWKPNNFQKTQMEKVIYI